MPIYISVTFSHSGPRLTLFFSSQLDSKPILIGMMCVCARAFAIVKTYMFLFFFVVRFFDFVHSFHVFKVFGSNCARARICITNGFKHFPTSLESSKIHYWRASLDECMWITCWYIACNPVYIRVAPAKQNNWRTENGNLAYTIFLSAFTIQILWTIAKWEYF